MIRSTLLLALAITVTAADPWDVAIAQGFPEVRGATAWLGEWRGSPALVTDWGGQLGFSKVHFRLADGRWLLHGLILHPAATPEELLEPMATLLPAGKVPTLAWSGPGSSALASLAARAGVPGVKGHGMVDSDAVAACVLTVTALTVQPEDHAALAAVAAALVPGADAAALARLPGWTLTYDPSVPDLLRERPTEIVAGSRCSTSWREADFPALIQALGDPSPSRTVRADGHIVSVGEHAAQALAQGWSLSPAEVTTIQADPRAGQGDLVTVLAGNPRLRPILHRPSVLSALTPARRAAAAAVIAEDWSRCDRAGREDLHRQRELLPLLNLIGNQPPIAAVVAGWPLAGTLRLPLAQWRDQQGDPTALDALLKESLDPQPEDRPPFGVVVEAWATAQARPSALRLGLLQRLLARDPQDPLWDRVRNCLGASGRRGDDGLGLAWWLYLAWNDPRPAVAALARTDLASARQRYRLPDGVQDYDSLRHYLRTRAVALGLSQPELGDLHDVLPAWWRQELAAAGRPVLLVLTDTVHCWPCQAFDMSILSQTPWKTWAATRVHQVVIDALPSQPEAAKRLASLAAIYGRGVPTVVLVKPDGSLMGPRLAIDHDLQAFIAACEERLQGR